MQHRQLTPAEWDALATDPEFIALERAKRAFVVPATLFFLAFYLAMLFALGWAPETLSGPFWGLLTGAWVWGLAQFAMAWLLLGIYLLRARSFDAMASAIVARMRREFVG